MTTSDVPPSSTTNTRVSNGIKMYQGRTCSSTMTKPPVLLNMSTSRNLRSTYSATNNSGWCKRQNVASWAFDYSICSHHWGTGPNVKTVCKSFLEPKAAYASSRFVYVLSTVSTVSKSYLIFMSSLSLPLAWFDMKMFTWKIQTLYTHPELTTRQRSCLSPNLRFRTWFDWDPPERGVKSILRPWNHCFGSQKGGCHSCKKKRMTCSSSSLHLSPHAAIHLSFDCSKGKMKRSFYVNWKNFTLSLDLEAVVLLKEIYAWYFQAESARKLNS